MAAGCGVGLQSPKTLEGKKQMMGTTQRCAVRGVCYVVLLCPLIRERSLFSPTQSWSFCASLRVSSGRPFPSPSHCQAARRRGRSVPDMRRCFPVFHASQVTTTLCFPDFKYLPTDNPPSRYRAWAVKSMHHSLAFRVESSSPRNLFTITRRVPSPRPRPRPLPIVNTLSEACYPPLVPSLSIRRQLLILPVVVCVHLTDAWSCTGCFSR